MKNSRFGRPGRLSSLALLAFFGVCPAASSAAILYESGTLGPTGMTIEEIIANNVPGTNVNPAVFVGVRFELTQSVVTSQIGGHFVSGTNSSFFGAIVALADKDDFPNSGDLSSPDVLGTAVLTFPTVSAETLGDLALPLDPGWYALVFGSGHFGATGSGAAVRNGTDISKPSYIGFQPGVGWLSLSDLSDVVTFSNHHFVLLGARIPEPSSYAMLAGAAICTLRRIITFFRHTFFSSHV